MIIYICHRNTKGKCEGKMSSVIADKGQVESLQQCF